MASAQSLHDIDFAGFISRRNSLFHLRQGSIHYTHSPEIQYRVDHIYLTYLAAALTAATKWVEILQL